ncbi:polysaccharide lyase 8 family protein [Arthrobacter sp. B2a2-09]|uniref:polysaccharide lyase 8 family protein n=1 Tax=Arthrobacter sp. B2a2-09 TaxID=2952822 RepID=UPI0022CD547F|nr:polysaccharide lyase 8 family protein [Arthrobacter sp. B2a2-09]MCZ9883659.1 polysaccharide lyase 8 family protein [Arthrobacter sp. B2a2-09]
MSELNVSRRNLFRGTGTLALAVALGSAFAPIANAAPDADLEMLRQRWVDQLTGRTVITTADQDLVSALRRLDSVVDRSRSLLVTVDSRTRIFTDADLSADPKITITYERLAQMATAWATPGSRHQGSPTVLAEILAGLQDGHRLVYNDSQQEFGNWWNWEIGTPNALADALAVVREHVSEAQVAQYCAAIDHFIPDPTLQFPDSRGKVISEGANRVDICRAIIIRSIVGGDTARLQAAITALSPTWQYVTKGDGFYPDGSFIQHFKLGYTGTYGVVLLNGLARLFSLLGPSAYPVSDPSRSILFDVVERSFAPFIHDGLMMDSVRGRAISRADSRGFDDGIAAIEAILWLARGVDAATSARWRSLCLGWLHRNTVTRPLNWASITRVALIKELFATTTVAEPEPTGHTYFPAMDRSVFRGDGWVTALGLSSRRIAWYECGNGENNTGYHTGSGLLYLYGADAGHWDDNFWPTANLNRLPGITADTTPLPPKVEGEWASRAPANEWTGGASRDGFGAVGFHLVGPGGTGLSARKSWFFTPEMVLALGSDIHTGSGASVESVVEHRNLGATGGRKITIDGAVLPASSGAPSVHPAARWAHVEGVGGYLLLGSEPLTVQRERRSGAWRDVNSNGPTQILDREYATMVIDHGAGPTGASYAYALMPGATPEQTASWTVPQVLRNDAKAQGARIGKLLAVSFWQPAQVGELASDKAAVVLCWQSPGIAKLAVSDPTGSAAEVVLILAGTKFKRVNSAARVQLERDATGTLTLRVPTAGCAGSSVNFELHP